VEIRNPLRIAAWILGTLTAFSSVADPPSHAPAHGWRKKNDPYYVGYTGRQWTDDYGVRGGRCDRDRIGTAVGAAVGGAIGAAVSDEENRLVAILAGATVGAVIGREIGDDMDDDDRACFGHSLELLDDGAKVGWQGSRKGITYGLVPDRRFDRDGRVCRHFTFVRVLDGRKVVKKGDACRFGDGDWRMVRS
jgi:surface antigen